jgi:hypothetical protein
MTPAKTTQGILCLDWRPHKRKDHPLPGDLFVDLKNLLDISNGSQEIKMLIVENFCHALTLTGEGQD